jgi:hypothetical protein
MVGNFFIYGNVLGSPTLLSPPSLCPGCGTFAISSINFNPANADQVFLTISTFGDAHLVIFPPKNFSLFVVEK